MYFVLFILFYLLQVTWQQKTIQSTVQPQIEKSTTAENINSMEKQAIYGSVSPTYSTLVPDVWFSITLNHFISFWSSFIVFFIIITHRLGLKRTKLRYLSRKMLQLVMFLILKIYCSHHQNKTGIILLFRHHHSIYLTQIQRLVSL